MIDRYVIDEIAVPSFFYGTAWKEERTRGLVSEALAAGFRAIDTANQRKHYHEVGVGEALAESYARGDVKRDDLFLQTKFTYVAGQDHRLPYDPRAPFAEQVEASFASSCEHLHSAVIDSYVLHGPSRRFGLGDADWETWQAMEALVKRGSARMLGVSNVSSEQLVALVKGAEVPPRMVQNRCFARTGWDADVRSFCAEQGIRYQGFSLLTANQRELARPEVRAIASHHGVSVAEVVFRFALQSGMIALTGTSDAEHMQVDLATRAAPQLSDDEIRTVLTCGR